MSKLVTRLERFKEKMVELSTRMETLPVAARIIINIALVPPTLVLLIVGALIIAPWALGSRLYHEVWSWWYQKTMRRLNRRNFAIGWSVVALFHQVRHVLGAEVYEIHAKVRELVPILECGDPEDDATRKRVSTLVEEINSLMEVAAQS